MEERPRTLKLFCPPVSKLIQLVAWDDQRLDLGSIARAFGLEPSTVKLNGHFISRGIDLVASSVTWRSLLSFFSAKGLSTGKDDGDALVVDGKLSKASTKRARNAKEEGSDRIQLKEKPECNHMCRSSQTSEDYCLLTYKKFRLCNSGGWKGECDWSPAKRKQSNDEIGSLKKLRTSETILGPGEGFPERVDEIFATAPCKCSFTNGNMKRMREDEPLVAPSCKRIR